MKPDFNALYSMDGKGLWKVVSYCEFPSVVMLNIFTQEQQRFGVHSPIAGKFQPIPGIELEKDNEGRDVVEFDVTEYGTYGDSL